MIEAIRRRLALAFESGRLPHALLFAGPPGSGKLETALWLARLLLCERGHDRPCAACGPCGRVGRGTHPDLLRLQPEGQFIKIEAVRSLIRSLGLKPFEARGRAVILEAADCLHEAAANALLKTLEEPPSGTYLVLLSSRPDALIETIRSRSQRVSFRPPPAASVIEALVAQGLDPADARRRVLHAGPSLEAAGALDGKALARVTAQALELAEKATGGRLDARGAAAIIQAAQDHSRDAESCARFLVSLKCVLRDAAIAALTADPRHLLEPELARRSAALGQRLGAPRTLAGLKAAEQVELDFVHNANRRLSLEALLLDLL